MESIASPMQRRDWVGGFLAAIGLGMIACTAPAFLLWRRRALSEVLTRGNIAYTNRGPVEYSLAGKGPVILQLHGGCSGYDQSLAFSWDLHERGFQVLTPSRPGYVRTPLAVGAAPDQAADAMAGLLDELDIDRVCVMGTSGGGPTALQFALRHPHRVWGLVLQSAITQQFTEPRRSTHSLAGRIIFSKRPLRADFAAWVLQGVSRFFPGVLIRSLLRASDDLDHEKAKERLRTIINSRDDLAFFRRVAAMARPLSVRQIGLKNDLQQFACLPDYPLHTIACPTLVIHGRADGNVPFSHAERVVQSVSGAELDALDDCGHFIWAGPQAKQCSKRVFEFLSRHASTTALTGSSPCPRKP